MAFILKPNSGSLFPNNRKNKDSHADRTGKCNVGGKLYYVSGWDKLTQDGTEWVSLAFKPIDEAEQRHAPVESQEQEKSESAPF